MTAAVNAFSEEGYTIETLDRATGIVSTEAQSNSSMQAAFIGSQSRKLQAMVRENPDGGSTLTLTLVWESQNAFGASTAQAVDADSAREMYEEWFGRIDAELGL